MALRKPRTLQAPPPPATQAGVARFDAQEGRQLQSNGPINPSGGSVQEGQPTQDAFGTPAQQRQLIDMVMQQTGMSEEQLQQLGDKGILHEQSKMDADPRRSTQGSSAQEVQRLVGDLTNQMASMTQGQPGASTQPVGPVAGPSLSPYAVGEQPRPGTPAQAGYAQMFKSEWEKMARELDMERENNIVNAGNESFAEAKRAAEREVLMSQAEMSEGSPEIRQEYEDAQNRRAMARRTVQDRLSRLSRRG